MSSAGSVATCVPPASRTGRRRRASTGSTTPPTCDAPTRTGSPRAWSRQAGTHTIWFVYTDNQTPADARCTKVADDLALVRPNRTRLLEPDPYFFEHQGLYRYPATG